jgi:pyridoxamine 5'-phosphate oxidase
MEDFSEKIQKLRNEYSDLNLNVSDLNSNPVSQFTKWLDEAIETKIYEPNAMVLATVDENTPRSRYVLFKNIVNDELIFHTNYESPKAKEIFANPNVSGIFYWAEIHRQVRFSGKAEKANAEISDEYFKTRPRGGQLSAWASEQSKIIASREIVTDKIKELDNEYLNTEIPRPEFWGGFSIKVNYWEFWQGRRNRTHDRFCYNQVGNTWNIERMSP